MKDAHMLLQVLSFAFNYLLRLLENQKIWYLVSKSTGFCSSCHLCCLPFELLTRSHQHMLGVLRKILWIFFLAILALLYIMFFSVPFIPAVLYVEKNNNCLADSSESLEHGCLPQHSSGWRD